MEVTEEIKLITMEDFTKMGIKCFKLIGLNLESRKEVTKKPKAFMLLGEFHFFLFLINIGLIVCALLGYAYKNLHDIKIVARVLPNLTNAPYLAIKLFVFYWNRDKIKDALSILEESFPKTEEDQLNLNVQTYLKEVKMFVKGFGFLIIVLQVVLIISQVVLIFMFGTTKLPLDIWLPFSYENFIIFGAVSLWMGWICFVVTTGTYAAEIILFATISLSSMKFDSIKRKCENIGVNELKTEEEELTNIKEIVEEQNEIFKFIFDWDKIFSSLFLYNFVQSSILLCFIIFLLSSSRDISTFVLYFPYLGTSLNQILLFCFLGQKIVNSSSSVAIGIYNSKWHQIKSLKIRKALLMILIRSQKPSALTLKKFGVMSFETFTKILAAAYSYFTLMKSFM
ncbi:CLUMA_CG017394, isoform A [Clunio marinus]|uniref:Odorant receptor n=1 Tax=Clunio marinus TaxID=568069 RepID=A0A1J1IW15_9DIPT|nr:CLUMA_CG017394, isoform A [Clunio marinus]